MARDIDALNYPYIRIRNVEWLKRTLLVFPHVIRMIPSYGAPADSEKIRPFCELEGRRGPLLRPATHERMEGGQGRHAEGGHC